MITVEFDRAKMRRYLLRFLAVFFAGTSLGTVIIVLLLPGGSISGVRAGWHGWLAIAAGGLVIGQFTVFLEQALALRRDLRQETAAVVITHAGITDNASQFALGQLGWNEIEKMYPVEMKSHLLLNWWPKLPVVFRQRGMAISLKENADLRHLLDNKPRWVQKLSQEWYRPRKGRWLFIPEMLLPVTAENLMTQINTFYIAEVRGY